MCILRNNHELWKVLFLLGVACYCDAWVAGFTQCQNSLDRITVLRSVSLNEESSSIRSSFGEHKCNVTPEFLVHWRGAQSEGFSDFAGQCQTEYESCVCTTLANRGFEEYFDNCKLEFSNALDFTDRLEKDYEEWFDSAMQYISSSDSNLNQLIIDVLADATKRSASARALYQIQVEADSFGELAEIATSQGTFLDMIDGEKRDSSWCIRVRQMDRERFGKKQRPSQNLAIQATNEMTQLLRKFGGKVELKNPNETIYIFENLTGRRRYVLTRKISDGAQEKMSSVGTKTRICVTSTPLRSLISFSMVNMAKLREGARIIDPFAGSCSIPLAVACIDPTCKSVAIEKSLAVRFENIEKDFEVRKLAPLAGLIRGDSCEPAIRDYAKRLVDNEEFDAIITDPPYGLREKIDMDIDYPIIEMMNWIINDRERGNRLLKKGGRIVAFCPNVETEGGEDIVIGLPSKELMDEAGVSIISKMKQPLNEALSRWLIIFECIK